MEGKYGWRVLGLSGLLGLVLWSVSGGRAAPPVTPEPGAAPEGRKAELTLTEVLEVARLANPDLRSAEERLRQAEALLARARAEFYPRLGLGEDYGLTNNPVTAFSFLLNQGQLSLDRDFNHPATLADFHTQVLVQQGVYRGGQRLAQARAAQAQRTASMFALAAVQNELAFRLAEAYYRLLQARDLVAVREAAVQQVQNHLQIVQVRFKAGTAVKSDVLSVEVRLAETQEALITARHQLQLAWALLENVTGAPLSDRPLPTQVPPAPWTEQVEQLETAIAEALERRPELAVLASQRQAAQENIRAAQAGKYPTLDVVGDYDVFSAGNFSRSNDSFFLGVVARLTLYDGGRTRSEVRQAEAHLREVLAQERRLALDIELAVRRAYLQLADARQRLQVAQRAVAQAAESLREIEVRYQGQVATLTQLLDAQVALSQAQVRRTNAQAEVEIARAALEQAVGRLASLIGP
jgi:outer membrane protein